jgi:TRAP-type C4-dicarboxylate transport system permease small subunit
VTAAARWLGRHAEEALAGACLAVVVIIVSVNVVLRYLFHDELTSASELATVLFVWIVMLGAGAAARERMHPSIQTLALLSRGRLRRAAGLLAGVATIGCLIPLIAFSWSFAFDQGASRFTGVLRLSYTWIYLALPVGFAFMLLRAAQATWHALRTADEEAMASGVSPSTAAGADAHPLVTAR